MNKLGNYEPGRGTASTSAPPPYFDEEAEHLGRINYSRDRVEVEGGDTGDGGNVKGLPKRIRMRAVGVVPASVEQQQLNLSTLRKLSLVLAVLLGNIFIFEVIGYSIVNGEDGWRKYILEGFCHSTWVPLVSFSIATVLTWFVARGTPSKCLVGTTMGFQLLSAVLGTVFVTIGTIVLLGARSFGSTAEPVLCSFMIVIRIVATVTMTGTFAKMLKLAGCDAKLNGVDGDIIFEVVDVESST